MKDDRGFRGRIFVEDIGVLGCQWSFMLGAKVRKVASSCKRQPAPMGHRRRARISSEGSGRRCKMSMVLPFDTPGVNYYVLFDN